MYNATLIHLRKIHEDLAIMRIKPDNPIRKHLPGQYTTLGLVQNEARIFGMQRTGDKLIRRSYSISCPILDYEPADWLEFYITLVREEQATLTPMLFALKEGDRLHMGEKIVGAYTLEGVPEDSDVYLLSTGTGEAPHNYMIWDLIRKNHKGKITLVSCVRKYQDLGYKDVHEKLADKYRFVPLATREDVAKVYIQDFVKGEKFSENSHFYLCGNPAMIGVPNRNGTYPYPVGVVEILEDMGFSSKKGGNIHFESYW